MKTITLLQPWATLISAGLKCIETRNWATDYRGPLAIHSSNRFPTWCRDVAASIGGDHLYPIGVVMCTCNLVDCLPMAAYFPRYKHVPVPGVFQRYPELDTPQERKFGDFDVFDGVSGRRRWAWVLADVRPLVVPVPVKGRLGMWEWDETHAA